MQMWFYPLRNNKDDLDEEKLDEEEVQQSMDFIYHGHKENI